LETYYPLSGVVAKRFIGSTALRVHAIDQAFDARLPSRTTRVHDIATAAAEGRSSQMQALCW
jgi:hypothetical protein